MEDGVVLGDSFEGMQVEVRDVIVGDGFGSVELWLFKFLHLKSIFFFLYNYQWLIRSYLFDWLSKKISLQGLSDNSRSATRIYII